MNLPVRTTVALFTVMLFAGVAQAAPVAPPADDASLLINVVDDATSENDAIDMDENKLPSPEGATTSTPPAATPAPSSTDDVETDELKRDGMED
ncbi:MAG: hypothetical protein ACR2J1_08035 [Methyloceanibacter sp.]|uniref:hypothetical protein n=1 Tax=Methyloceanibacter sp. TaxID=1965321 RepID=UPI003D9ACD7F